MKTPPPETPASEKPEALSAEPKIIDGCRGIVEFLKSVAPDANRYLTTLKSTPVHAESVLHAELLDRKAAHVYISELGSRLLAHFDAALQKAGINLATHDEEGAVLPKPLAALTSFRELITLLIPSASLSERQIFYPGFDIHGLIGLMNRDIFDLHRDGALLNFIRARQAHDAERGARIRAELAGDVAQEVARTV